MKAIRVTWELLRDAVEGFIAHGALSRGGSIAYFTLFSIAPVLLVVVAVAGLAFGRRAAEGAIVTQLSSLMGEATARALQAMIGSAGKPHEGIIASIIGVGVLIVATSGVFGEVQAAMNQIWESRDKPAFDSVAARARPPH